MRRQEQYALASGIGALVVFKAVVNNHAAHILLRVSGKQADFRQLASQGREDTAQDLATLAGSFVRECQQQIAKAGATEPRMQQVDGPRQGNSQGAGGWTRNRAQNFDEQPDGRVLE